MTDAMRVFPPAKTVADEAVRASANVMLDMVSPSARELFHRIHDNSPWKSWENCPVEYGGQRPLSSAHDLLCRTLNQRSKQ